jgi:hypothetical protein
MLSFFFRSPSTWLQSIPQRGTKPSYGLHCTESSNLSLSARQARHHAGLFFPLTFDMAAINPATRDSTVVGVTLYREFESLPLRSTSSASCRAFFSAHLRHGCNQSRNAGLNRRRGYTLPRVRIPPSPLDKLGIMLSFFFRSPSTWLQSIPQRGTKPSYGLNCTESSNLSLSARQARHHAGLFFPLTFDMAAINPATRD